MGLWEGYQHGLVILALKRRDTIAAMASAVNKDTQSRTRVMTRVRLLMTNT